MAQTNIESKFTVFSMVNNENVFYVMSPTQLWTKEENDNEVAARLLGVDLENFYITSKKYSANLKEINNYTIISFSDRKKALKFAKLLNDAYILYKYRKYKEGAN